MKTKTKEKVYQFILHFYDTHGYSPTIREVGDAVGLSSPSTVHGHISNLVKEGKLHKKDSSPRTIVTSLNRVESEIRKMRYGTKLEATVTKVNGKGTIEEVKIGDKVFRLAE